MTEQMMFELIPLFGDQIKFMKLIKKAKQIEIRSNEQASGSKSNEIREENIVALTETHGELNEMFSKVLINIFKFIFLYEVYY